MYKLIGNFSTGNFSCIVKDIFLMDIGNSAYTEYEFSERFIKYRMEHPETLDYELGHVHSHNTMSTFFSGTDISELQDNAPNHNYYLSLIVNNVFEPKAKIAFVGKQKKKESIVRSFFGDNGRLYKFNSNQDKEEDVLFVYNCDIEFTIEYKVSSEFENRLYEIVLEKEKKAEAIKQTKATNKYTTTNYTKYNTESFNKPRTANKSVVIEELLSDVLLQQYSCEKNLDEAIFIGNKDFVEKGSLYITECGSWLRNMGPYMLGYVGEYDIKDEDLVQILEAILFYEDEFPEFVEALTTEFINE